TLTLLREQLAPILPKAKVFRMQDMAEAREQQRRLMEAQLGKAMPKVIDGAIQSQTNNLEKTFTKMLPAMIFLCGLSVAALAMLNTRDRRQEIGVFRALGHGGLHIAILFLGKAVAIGIAGAIIGYGVGGYITFNFGQELFALTKSQLGWEPSLLIEALWLAPAFAALATFIPAMLAVVQDPADTLRHD
ncbi:MAG: FtsX-like permease family protein, partial [Verrucomicrobiota bacterium]|nr:FtsX-like permease family protein [Verrucomicrobiota bacterium]